MLYSKRFYVAIIKKYAPFDIDNGLDLEQISNERTKDERFSNAS